MRSKSVTPPRQFAAAVAGSILARTPLRFWPVRIRHGFLRGCRWTLWPHSAYWRGHYESAVQDALLRHAPPAGAAAWDLGAHFGFYTLMLGRAVGPAGQVCAFEPDPVSFARLRRHVRMNRMAQVRLYPLAASDHHGERELIQDGGPGATTSHLPYPGENVAAKKSIAVRTMALDELANRDHLAPPRLVKIDVEGQAAAALRGARELIAAHHPTLLVSLHSPDEADGVSALLAPAGYAPFRLDGARTSWSEALFQTVILQA